MAAVCILVGPTTTEDAAHAFVPPPVVAALSDLGPASVLEFTPWGFGLTAAAIAGWMLWDNRATVTSWAHDAWCAMAGGSDCAARSSNQPNTANIPSTSGSHYADVSWSLARGATSNALTAIYTCALTPAGTDLVRVGSGDVCAPNPASNPDSASQSDPSDCPLRWRIVSVTKATRPPRPVHVVSPRRTSSCRAERIFSAHTGQAQTEPHVDRPANPARRSSPAPVARTRTEPPGRTPSRPHSLTLDIDERSHRQHRACSLF